MLSFHTSQGSHRSQPAMAAALDTAPLPGPSGLATAGMAVTWGSAAAVATGIACAMAGAEAMLPLPTGEWLKGWSAMQHSAPTAWWAGTLGLLAHILLAAGASVCAVAQSQSQRTKEALGWTLITLASLGFIAVAALAGRVLPVLAQLDPHQTANRLLDSLQTTYASARALHDVLYTTGTLTLGLGVWWAHTPGAVTTPGLRILGRLLGACTAAVATIGLLGWPTGMSQGICVGLASLLFLIKGWRMWHQGQDRSA